MRLGTVLLMSVLGCCATIFSGCGAYSSEKLAIYTEEYPPYSYTEKGELKGAAVALVQEMQKRAGDTTPIVSGVWKTVYERSLKRKNTAVFSTTRTTAREPLFRWVGPLVNNETVLFAKADSKIKITSLEQAKGYTIGVYRDSVVASLLQDAGLGKQLVVVSNDDMNAKNLMDGKIQLWAGGGDTLPLRMVKAGYAKTDMKKVFLVASKPMFIAFNKDTDASIVAAWQAAYDAMKKDGTYDRILAAHK